MTGVGLSKNVPRVVSLFSGAMGLDLGLERAGFEIRVAVESDPTAIKTIRANRPDLPVLEKPIEKVSTEKILMKAGLAVGEVDLLAGGPACQAFSTAGKRRSLADPLGRLFYEFMRVVDEARPKFFLVENVRGLLSAAIKHRPLAQRGGKFPPLEPEEELGSAFAKMAKRLRQSDYYVVFDVLNAADFGAAQTRQRLILIGSRAGVRVSMPAPTHCKDAARRLPLWKTLRETLEGLRDDVPEYIEFVPSRRKYFACIPPGGNWRDLPKEMQVKALGGAMKSWGGRSGFYRRLSWDRPSPTLNTNPDYKATTLCHPDEPRPLSVREYSRIQGFPADWAVYGSIRQRYRQLGNAVPVEMAAALGGEILNALGKRGARRRLGKVESRNLHLLNALSRRTRTCLNPPRMRGKETAEETRRWTGGKSSVRNDAEEYTPRYLSGAVGKTKLVKKILERLRTAYGSPDLGNYNDPIDELFFILLSQRTTGPSYERVFLQLKEWVSNWQTLPTRSVQQVAQIISHAGLSQQKANYIVEITKRLCAEFGHVTLEPLTNRPDPALQAFLTSLPGVGVKTAKCVMLFSFGREVLPVDGHVARIAERVGLIDPSASKSRTHEVLEAVVPREARFDFHVNAVAHGRAVCRALSPKCDGCQIRRVCLYGNRTHDAENEPTLTPSRQKLVLPMAGQR